MLNNISFYPRADELTSSSYILLDVQNSFLNCIIYLMGNF